MLLLSSIQIDIPEWVLAGAVLSTLLLFIAIIAVFTKLVQHLGSFADALRSHARLNQQLNEELAKAIEQRQALQAKYDTLESDHRQLKADNGRLTSRVSQLEQDKTSNREIVEALTAQLATVKADLETERQKRQTLESKLETEKKERERIVREMRGEIDQLTAANVKLVAENQELRQQVDELRARADHRGDTHAEKDSQTPAASDAPAEKKEV